MGRENNVIDSELGLTSGKVNSKWTGSFEKDFDRPRTVRPEFYRGGTFLKGSWVGSLETGVGV